MNKRPMSEEHKQKIREGLARRKKEKEESRIIDPGIAKIKDIKLTSQDVKNLRLLRARKTLPGFVEHVLRDMNGSKVKNAAHQIAWWEHFKYSTKIRKTTVILASMAHGKCVTALESILMPSGDWVEAGSLLNKEFEVIGFDEKTGTFHPATARCGPNGIKPIVKLTTWSGKEIKCTENHPIWTDTGWVLAENLVVDNFVAAAKRVPHVHAVPMLPGEAALLGYFIGDGSTGGSSNSMSSHITNADTDVIYSICSSAKQLGFTAIVRPTPSKAKRIDVSAGSRAWLRLHGVAGCTSHTKKTPPAVFRGSLDDIRQYIGAYFDCDGTVPTTCAQVSISSVNKQLLRDVQHLYSRLGLVSYLRQKNVKYKGEVRVYWDLSVSGQENLQTFLDEIPICKIKRDRVISALAPYKTKANGNKASAASNNADNVPIKSLLGCLKKAPHWHKVHTGVSLDHKPKRGIARKLACRVAEAEDNEDIRRLCADNIWWDRIVKIERLPPEETFAIEVDKYHTYVANDIVVHNTNWIAIALPLWLLGQNENLRIMMVSSAEKIATERLKVIGDYIKRSDAYHELFPWVVPDESSEWNSNRINVRRRAHDGGMVGSINASVSAYGYTSREGIGARSDVLIFDDVIDDINSRNPAGRETLKSLVETQWITRGEPVPILDRWGGVLSDDQIHVVVGTRYNPEDWYGTCLGQPNAYCTLVQAISQDFNGIDCTIIGANETPEHPLYTKYKNSPILKRSEYDDYFAAMDAAKQDSTLVVDDSVVNQPTVT